MTSTSHELTKRCIDAMKLADDGKTEEADVLYSVILEDAEAINADGLPEICGEIASLKFRLGLPTEALAFNERALHEARTRSDGTETLRVAVYRHFVGECLLHLRRHGDALNVIEPGLGHDDSADRFLLITHARALLALAEHDRAEASAVRALALAKSDEQRTCVKELIDAIQGGKSAG